MDLFTPEMTTAFKKAKMELRAIDHKLRQEMLKLLQTEMTVTQIYCELRIEQSVASQHLAILRKGGLVKVQRHGKEMHYSLNTERLNHLYQLSLQITLFK